MVAIVIGPGRLSWRLLWLAFAGWVGDLVAGVGVPPNLGGAIFGAGSVELGVGHDLVAASVKIP